MLYCPFCQTANRLGSQFCNQCGRRLGEEGRICPGCQTLHPLSHRYCARCGMPLPETVGVSAGSASDAPLSPDDVPPAELPALEAEVPILPGQPAPSERADGPDEASRVEDRIEEPLRPEWLLTTAREPAAGRQLPDWLFLPEDDASPEPEPPAPVADEDVWALMRRLREEANATPAPRPRRGWGRFFGRT